MLFDAGAFVSLTNWFVLNGWFSKYIPLTGISLETVDSPNINDVKNPAPKVVPIPTDSEALKNTLSLFLDSK